MTEITVDKHLIILCIFILIWVFCLGVYIQYYYNIGDIKISSDIVYTILGVLLGISITKLYEGVFK